MKELIAKVDKCTTEQIVACARLMLDVETTEERMVRAALIEVYSRREGEVAADRLMDELGL